MSGGTFNVSRTIWTHPAFADEPFSEREAFMWMVGEASWKAREVRVGKIVAHTERGQLAASVRFMAEAWRWSKSRVLRFLKRLENRDTIRTESGTGILVITVCDYDDFQARPADSGTEAGHLAGQKRDRSGTNEKQDKKDKKEEDKREAIASPKKGTRIPDEFPGHEQAEWALGEGLPPDRLQRTVEDFRDYWLGATGQRASKADWPATWRKWIRKALDDLPKQKKGKTDDFASLMAFADRFDQRREAERQMDSGAGSGSPRPLLPGGDGPGGSSADAHGLDRRPVRPAAGGHRDGDDGMAPVVWFTAKAR